MIKKLFFFFVCMAFANANAQVLPASRAVDWSLSGYRGAIPNYTTVVDITSYGASVNDTIADDSAFINALNALSGSEGVIYFPAGNYIFTTPLNLRSGLILRGAAADSTTLQFNLGNNNSYNCITIYGSATATTAMLTNNASKDSAILYIDDTTGFSAGDYIKLKFNDSSLLYSSWAYGSVGQIIKIAAVTDSALILESPLRMDYSTSLNPMVIKLNMVTNVGIECLKIYRTDTTSNQTNNIQYNYAAQCWVSGIESYETNFAHIQLNNSTNISISGSYFHHAYAYGGNGQGYGVLCQTTTGECLIENNVFNHLRHSMILQAGANGNVYGYNYSIDPFWTEPSLPSNSAGDMVLHGNYVYANLFEGNIGQNIVIDDSHGHNGPYNTFFRNRAELYGIFMNNNPASDNQNFIGNEVTNTGFTMGLYYLNGTGHFQHGNNVKGTIYANGTTTLNDSSYYSATRPTFLQQSANWPSVGIPNTINTGTIPAKERYANANFTTCSTVLTTGISSTKQESVVKIVPNPSSGIVYLQKITAGNETLKYSVYNITGSLITSGTCTENITTIDLVGYNKGLYIVRVECNGKPYTPYKLVLQ